MRPQSLSGAEIAAYAAELAATVAYATILHHKGPREHPDHTWKLVMIGVIISSAPAIALARHEPPPTWQRYERRVAAGFLLSAAVIVPWQLWLTAERQGELRQHRRSMPHDPPETLE
jgi:magnesium-transporting ATPase (P-type)